MRVSRLRGQTQASGNSFSRRFSNASLGLLAPPLSHSSIFLATLLSSISRWAPWSRRAVVFAERLQRQHGGGRPCRNASGPIRLAVISTIPTTSVVDPRVCGHLRGVRIIRIVTKIIVGFRVGCRVGFGVIFLPLLRRFSTFP